MVAGSGPLLLAVAAYLRKRGRRSALVAEQADQAAVTRFGVDAGAPSRASSLQAIRLRAGVRYLTGCWPVSAEPGAVTLRRRRRTWTERCDYLACGFGLVPNTELAMLLGCGGRGRRVSADGTAGIYAAGEVTGIGGLDLSIVEGEIAGYAAGGPARTQRARCSPRASATGGSPPRWSGHSPAPGIGGARAPTTRWSAAARMSRSGASARCSGWREAKLQTRCGMGPCQGRVCGAAVEFLLGWKSESVRPPLFPARIRTLSANARE